MGCGSVSSAQFFFLSTGPNLDTTFALNAVGKPALSLAKGGFLVSKDFLFHQHSWWFIFAEATKKLRIKVRSSFYAQFIYTIVGFTAFILQIYRKADSIFRKIIGINLTIV